MLRIPFFHVRISFDEHTRTSRDPEMASRKAWRRYVGVYPSTIVERPALELVFLFFSRVRLMANHAPPERRLRVRVLHPVLRLAAVAQPQRTSLRRLAGGAGVQFIRPGDGGKRLPINIAE